MDNHGIHVKCPRGYFVSDATVKPTSVTVQLSSETEEASGSSKTTGSSTISMELDYEKEEIINQIELIKDQGGDRATGVRCHPDSYAPIKSNIFSKSPLQQLYGFSYSQPENADDIFYFTSLEENYKFDLSSDFNRKPAFIEQCSVVCTRSQRNLP